jgi:hypothetical protein
VPQCINLLTPLALCSPQDVDPLFEQQRSKIGRGTATLNSARQEMHDTLEVAAGTMSDLERQREVITNVSRNVRPPSPRHPSDPRQHNALTADLDLLC